MLDNGWIDGWMDQWMDRLELEIYSTYRMARMDRWSKSYHKKVHIVGSRIGNILVELISKLS